MYALNIDNRHLKCTHWFWIRVPPLEIRVSDYGTCTCITYITPNFFISQKKFIPCKKIIMPDPIKKKANTGIKEYTGVRVGDDIRQFGGSKVVSRSEKSGTFSSMSKYRQDKISRRNDVLAERAIKKAKNKELRLAKKKGRGLTIKERKGILTSSGSGRTSNRLNSGSKVGNFLRSINPFRRRKK